MSRAEELAVTEMEAMLERLADFDARCVQPFETNPCPRCGVPPGMRCTPVGDRERARGVKMRMHWIRTERQ